MEAEICLFSVMQPMAVASQHEKCRAMKGKEKHTNYGKTRIVKRVAGFC